MARPATAYRWGLALLAGFATAGAGSAAGPDDRADRPAATLADLDPQFLRRPLESPPPGRRELTQPGSPPAAVEPLVQNPVLPPLRYAGPSSVAPREVHATSDFVPV